MTTTYPPSLPSAWLEALLRSGFSLAENGFRQNGLLFKPGPRWLSFETHLHPNLTAPTGQLPRQLGLWKRLRESPPGSGVAGPPIGRMVFDLPSVAVSRQVRDEFVDPQEDISLDACLRWVSASADNALPEGWSAPTRERVESWLPPRGLTVQHGGFVCQGQILLQPGVWSLRFPLATRLPSVLPAEREVVLRQVIGDAEDQWRMVRLGFGPAEEEGMRALLAEVDLSGAPHAPPLFLAGLDALRHVVLWLVETVDLLADVTVTMRSLAVCCPNPTQEERSCL